MGSPGDAGSPSLGITSTAPATQATAPASASASGRERRVNLKVLVLCADGHEPTCAAWAATLEQEGVPYDVFVAQASHETITADTLLTSSGEARYQALILATGGLACMVGGQFVSALGPDEWATLEEFQRTFGIRRLTAFAYPSPRFGLSSPVSCGSAGSVAAALTRAGRSLFPELRGPVALDPGAYCYRAKPLGPEFQSLLSGSDGAALLGIFMHPDRPEEMVCTVDASSSMIHQQLLGHGMLHWVTRGVYLGQRRHYLGLHVDDVFLSAAGWDSKANATLQIRTQADDVREAARWSRATGLRLDLAFNGQGARQDDATKAFLQQMHCFGWINHTYAHPNLDDADVVSLVSQIECNSGFANARNLPFDRAELVTGEHSGLANASMPAALSAASIRWIASDASRTPGQAALGPALTVPRHPTNVYCNVASQSAQLDQYNHRHLPASRGGCCVDSSVTSCFSRPATWQEFVDHEARIMFDHVLGNDPRPHYFHQANLTGDRNLYTVVDELLKRYRTYLKPPLVQLSMAQIGGELARRVAWRRALAADHVTAFLQDGIVHVSTRASIAVPLTGTEIGSDYGDQRSGWSEPISAADGERRFAAVS